MAGATKSLRDASTGEQSFLRMTPAEIADPMLINEAVSMTSTADKVVEHSVKQIVEHLLRSPPVLIDFPPQAIGSARTAVEFAVFLNRLKQHSHKCLALKIKKFEGNSTTRIEKLIQKMRSARFDFCTVYASKYRKHFKDTDGPCATFRSLLKSLDEDAQTFERETIVKGPLLKLEGYLLFLVSKRLELRKLRLEFEQLPHATSNLCHSYILRKVRALQAELRKIKPRKQSTSQTPIKSVFKVTENSPCKAYIDRIFAYFAELEKDARDLAETVAPQACRCIIL